MYIPKRVAQEQANQILGEKARLIEQKGRFYILKHSQASKNGCYGEPIGMGYNWVQAIVSTEQKCVADWMKSKNVEITQIPQQDGFAKYAFSINGTQSEEFKSMQDLFMYWRSIRNLTSLPQWSNVLA